MPVPLSYSLHSLKERWSSALIAIAGIAGTVGVFIAVLALAHGFKATLISSGSKENAIVSRAGSSSEAASVITLDGVHVIQDAPGIRNLDGRPELSAEVVVLASFPLKSSRTDANVQIRGVSPGVLNVRQNIKMTAGEFIRPGLNELVLGRNLAGSYEGLELGKPAYFGSAAWKVVGIFDSGGTAFDSEIWADANVLNQVYRRPASIVQSVTVRLSSPDAFSEFKNSLTADPRLKVQVERESEYYDKQSGAVTRLVTILGGIVAIVMGIGAVFGAITTMYSAAIDRSREIATLRAIGFGMTAVVICFLFEAICIALAGGIIGCLGVLPLNGFTASTMNLQSFSHVAFALRIDRNLMVEGLLFAVFMGVLGGIPPVIWIARQNIAVAFREL